MRISRVLVLLCVLMSFDTQAQPTASDADHVPGVLLIKIADPIQEAAAVAELNALGAIHVQPLLRTKKQPVGSPLARWREVHFGKGVNLQLTMDRLSKNKLFSGVQFNHILTLTATPNDPKYSSQWGLPKINAPSAWNLTTGSTNVVVGVIDTGIDMSHPDLAANIWTNPGEIPGNGIDDDGNGYIDDVHGYDFGNNDADPTDYVGHGTHVAGTIAAVGNNGVGVTGVNWTAKLMAVKIFDDNGNGTEADAINGIYYASANGAVVTNNSWGLYYGVQPYGSQATWDAIVDAYQKQVLFIAAAGNDGGTVYSWADRSDMTNIFPNYALPNVIVVAATDQNDSLASFSNYGSSVDLAAPGVGILSTVPKYVLHTYYTTMDGTSMACPHVTGVAALVKSLHPNIDFLDLKNRVENTVDHLTNLASAKLITGGRLNAYDAVTAAPATTVMNWVSTPASPIPVGGPLTLSVYVEPALGGALMCDPKVNNCGPGSYGKVRLYLVPALVSVDPLFSWSNPPTFWDSMDTNLVYNSATGRYEASWNMNGLSVSQTFKAVYLGTSTNLPSSVSAQVVVQ